MASTSVSAVARTNVPKQSIKKDFLSKFTDFLCDRCNTDTKHITVEIQADVTMMRGGLTSPMMNISFYHNTDVINQMTKTQYAGSIAKFIAEELRIPVDRYPDFNSYNKAGDWQDSEEKYSILLQTITL